MNNVILVGRLTRDPEIRYAEGQKQAAIASYTMAVDRKYKREGQPTADFINCKCFGKNAEFMEKYFRKGMKIAVKGSIQTGSYTNKDGHKIYTTDIIVEEQEFVESKNQSSGAEKSNAEPSKDNGDGFMNIPDGIDESLPFN